MNRAPKKVVRNLERALSYAKMEGQHFGFRLQWRQSWLIPELEAALGLYLLERDLFPTTRDVIEAINATFDLDLKFDKFRRAGRRPAIRKAQRHLRSIPKFRQRLAARRLIQLSPSHDTHSRQYRQLFSTLLRHDPHP